MPSPTIPHSELILGAIPYILVVRFAGGYSRTYTVQVRRPKVQHSSTVSKYRSI